MSLDSLRITECPAAFLPFAEKHNAVVDMLAAMRGENGVTVVMAEKNGIIRGTGGAAALSNVAFAVMGDGMLQNVYVGNTNGNQWPTALKTFNANGNVVANATGLYITKASGNTCAIAFANITRPIAFVEVDVCEGTTSKHMLVLGSAPY